jgi:hypothetical protein
MGAEFFHADRLPGRHDEAYSRFLQFLDYDKNELFRAVIFCALHGGVKMFITLRSGDDIA